MRFFLAVILAIFFVSAAHAERRVALVIADDDYRNVRPLKNAVNDSRTIESALQKLGFEVTTETNRDLKRMRRALEDFRDEPPAPMWRWSISPAMASRSRATTGCCRSMPIHPR